MRGLVTSFDSINIRDFVIFYHLPYCSRLAMVVFVSAPFGELGSRFHLLLDAIVQGNSNVSKQKKIKRSQTLTAY